METELKVPVSNDPHLQHLIQVHRHRLAQRQKQIMLGKCTTAYANYIRNVPVAQRLYERRHTIEPITPDIHRPCSKRAWEGLARQWRRLLHGWDQLQPQDPAKEDNKIESSILDEKTDEYMQSQDQALANLLWGDL